MSNLEQMNIDKIQIEAEQYQAELEKHIPIEINSCIEKLTTLSFIHARLGYMISKMKMYVRQIKADRLSTYTCTVKDNYLSAKMQDALMDGFAISEVHLLETLQYQYNSCLIQMENCRTIISKEKEEMKLAGLVQQM